MILLLIRIPVTLFFLFSLAKMALRSPELSGGDMILLLGYGLLGSIIVAILWAPVIGEKLSGTITGSLTDETSLPAHSNSIVSSIQKLQLRGYHRPALLLVFLEGMRHPDLPQAALLGLRSSRPGSFLEKAFAKEVYHFNNIQNCLLAYKILTERHHFVPPLHKQPEVNLAILNLTRQPPPEPAKLQIATAATPATPERNRRIRLFAEPPSPPASVPVVKEHAPPGPDNEKSDQAPGEHAER